MAFKLFRTSILCFLIWFIAQHGFAQIPNSKKVDFPASYTFDYNYKLKMTTQSQKEDMVIEYFLKKDGDYFGFKMNQMKTDQGDMFFVMDNRLNVTVMFMNMMGQKMVQASSLNMKELTKDAAESNKDFSIRKIGTKTILGYECQGFVTDNDEAEIAFYIAENAPVNFNKMWDANSKNMPKGFDARNDMTMTCVGLEKTDFAIKTSDYKSSMFGG